MVPAINSVQALAVLYDLALTIGSEVTVEALLTKTLQRFLYHTGFHAGLVYANGQPADDPAWHNVRVETAIGIYALVKRRGECLRLPAALLGQTAALGEAPASLAQLPARKPYRFYLHLPIGNFGAMLLLSSEPPESSLPLTELFLPIMARLATAISLCQRIRERTEAQERVNHELEAFAYSVSHDLRAPLRAIDGYSRMLLEDYGGKFDEQGQHLLDAMHVYTLRMERLIDDILGFSRMAGREMQAAVVDMNAVAREVAEEAKAAAPGRDLRIGVADLPAARGDRAMIRQVLVNLFGNAVKFTQPRDVARIEMGCTADTSGNAYFVRDNGVGFDMQYGDKLFGLFQRLHSADDFEGTGAGLAIVKRIVARHGGRVWAEGQVGAGATFHFTLPRGDTTCASRDA